MDTDWSRAAQRLDDFAVRTLEPAVFPVRSELDVAVFQTSDAVPYEQAIRRPYRAVSRGWRWGPAWSTAWFRIEGTVPEAIRTRPAALLFSCGTEALLWRDGAPYHGLDAHHDTVLLGPQSAAVLGPLYVEAACNRPLGVTLFWWDDEEAHARWREPNPGVLERCELAVFDESAWRLACRFRFVRDAMLALAPDPERERKPDVAAAHRLLDRLEQATTLVEAGHPGAALQTLEQPRLEPVTTHAVTAGHGHIDTAWLWPIRETTRKCLRSWATALRLLERFPDLVFVATQPQQYAWVRASSPELFEAIRRAVTDGRWEPAGPMWVEPDANIPSGESLVRQLIVGLRWLEDAFGPRGPRDVLFLPDTFGFPASLPQIAQLAGIDTFVCNKLSWNETNAFPHITWRWRGIDGTELLAHTLPGREYNFTNTAAELADAACHHREKTAVPSRVWFQPFGHGDGGGGPTDRMVEHARLARGLPGLPETSFGGLAAFRTALLEDREMLRANGRDHPVWDGELYLERHRGTYTSQAWIKRANRRLETSLRAGEWLTTAAPPGAAVETHGADLAAAWRAVLLNQFHDILPGTSIAAVYDDARTQLAEAATRADAAGAAGARAWASMFDTRNAAEPWLVLNPTSTVRSGVVELDGRLHFAAAVPAMGGRVVDTAAAVDVRPVIVDERTLSNGVLTARLDERGRVVTLRTADGVDRAGAGVEGGLCALNELALYEDTPSTWDAWELEADYLEHRVADDDTPARIRVVERGPLRGAIEVERPLGAASRITQRFELTAASTRLDVRTHIAWHDRRRVLRVLFSTPIRSRHASYGIQFGAIERPTNAETSRDRAKFEVCAHRWMDLSEPGRGLALLDDGKYGHSCRGGVMGLTLLRAPEFPDPDCDRGEHTFAYALLPHAGDPRAAGVVAEAEAFDAPFLAVRCPVAAGAAGGAAGAVAGAGAAGPAWAPFAIAVEGAAHVEVAAVKPPESSGGMVLRLVEMHGRAGRVAIDWRRRAGAVRAVDLLERPHPDPAIEHDPIARRTVFGIRPFQIVTLLVDSD